MRACIYDSCGRTTYCTLVMYDGEFVDDGDLDDDKKR